MKHLGIKYLQIDGSIQKKNNVINIDQVLDSQHDELEGGHRKNQARLFMPYYNINSLFQKSFLVKEALSFHYLKN